MAQICEALFGDMHKEKIATQREITRKLELENAITTASVLNRAELAKGFAELAEALAGTAMNSDLPRSAKKNSLNNLTSWPPILEGVARNQRRLPRGNGTRPESEGEER
jgi:hypothetical protein